MKKNANLKVVKRLNPKVSENISGQILQTSYNLKSLRRAHKEHTHMSKELLIAILEILASKKTEDFETIICRFIEGIGLGKSPLSYFLQILLDKPLLRFMAINQLQKISYNSQLQILNTMEQHWPEDINIINKLSHLSHATHRWTLEHGESPFNKIIATEEILKCLVRNSEDIDGLEFESTLPKSDHLQVAAQ